MDRDAGVRRPKWRDRLLLVQRRGVHPESAPVRAPGQPAMPGTVVLGPSNPSQAMFSRPLSKWIEASVVVGPCLTALLVLGFGFARRSRRRHCRAGLGPDSYGWGPPGEAQIQPNPRTRPTSLRLRPVRAQRSLAQTLGSDGRRTGLARCGRLALLPLCSGSHRCAQDHIETSVRVSTLKRLDMYPAAPAADAGACGRRSLTGVAIPEVRHDVAEPGATPASGDGHGEGNSSACEHAKAAVRVCLSYELEGIAESHLCAEADLVRLV